MEMPYSQKLFGILNWYSLLIVLGILAAVHLMNREALQKGLPQGLGVDIALWAVPFGIIGSRIYYVAFRWQDYAENPISALYIWEGGVAIYGAILGGALGIALLARHRRLPCRMLMDIVTPALLLAQALGRWGNYFNMEAYGKLVTEESLQFFPLCVLIGDEWHMATFFYESCWDLGCLLALLKLKKKCVRNGQTLLWYFLLYGSGRLVIERFRDDSLKLGELRVSEWLSLSVCLVCVLLLFRNHPAFGKSKAGRNEGEALPQRAPSRLRPLARTKCVRGMPLLHHHPAFGQDKVGMGEGETLPQRTPSGLRPLAQTKCVRGMPLLHHHPAFGQDKVGMGEEEALPQCTPSGLHPLAQTKSGRGMPLFHHHPAFGQDKVGMGEGEVAPQRTPSGLRPLARTKCGRGTPLAISFLLMARWFLTGSPLAYAVCNITGFALTALALRKNAVTVPLCLSLLDLAGLAVSAFGLLPSADFSALLTSLMSSFTLCADLALLFGQNDTEEPVCRLES